MSQHQHLEPGNHQQPGWPDPEESCGEFVTKLSEEESAWMAKGLAAEVWKTLSRDIRRLVESEDFRWFGVSFFFYMIGKDKSKASPRIIFCSSDRAARKKIRKAVRQSNILEPYPQIRLGDSSSPLVRGDSGLNRIGPQSFHGRLAGFRGFRQRQGRGTDRLGSPEAGSSSTFAHQGVEPSGSQTLRVMHMSPGRELHIDFDNKLSISGSHSPESCNNSAFEATSFRSRHSSEVSAPSSKSSVFVEDPEQSLSDTTTVKGEACGSSDGGCCDAGDSSDDYESFSETESTPELVPLDSSPVILRERREIVRKLLDAFDSYQQLPWSGDTQDTPQICYGEQQGSTNASASSGANKRPAGALEKEMLNPGDASAPGIRTKKAKTVGQKGKTLACPYWKKDRWAFSQCSKLDLKEVKNVKQHLHRKHTKKIRCPKCQSAFRTEEERDDHVRFTSCPFRDVVEDSGISGDQMKELNKKGPATQTQWERWYVVWRIVFPQLSPPSSPYLEDDLSEDMHDFREFFRSHGSTLILDHMRTSPSWTPDDESRFSHHHWAGIFGTALEAIHRRWTSQRPRLQANRRRDPAPIPGGSSQAAVNNSSSLGVGDQEHNDAVAGGETRPAYQSIPVLDDNRHAVVDTEASFDWLDEWNDLEDLPSPGFDMVPQPDDDV